jgi:hypothetical protein
MKDFFISYNKADRAWAEWIAWHLDAGLAAKIGLPEGDLAVAKHLSERALAIGEVAFGASHPSVASFANNLGQVLKAQGDLSEGEAFPRTRVEKLSRSPGGPSSEY